MKLIAKPVHLFCTEFNKITHLLKSAFPKKEQTPMFLLLLGALRKNTHFTAFYDADKFAGLLYTIENTGYYFILYIAVNPEMRSCGIGGEILDYAYAQAGDKIIVLNVEPLDSSAYNHEQRKRRIAFYARHGILETGYGFSMDGIEYSVLASDTKKFTPKAYSDMLGGIQLRKKYQSGVTILSNYIFGRATRKEMPRILAMQADVFSGEQGIPADDIDTFMAKDPLCWCAESPEDGKIYAAVAAWNENGETHWGRFVVFPAARGHHLGTALARVSFNDLFDMGVDKVYMDARDATVKIVCGMGGRVVGEPYKFYEGNVTPVVLEKKDYVRS